MKHKFLLAVLMTVVLIFPFQSCEKVPIPDFDQELEHLSGEGIINIKVSYAEDIDPKAAAMYDTLMTEGNKVLSFAYTSTIPMTSQMWTFHDGTTSNSKIGSYLYWGFDIKPITLITFDGSGNSYETVAYVDLFPRGNGDPVIWVGSTSMGANVYKVDFAIYKNGIDNRPGNYLVKGSVTSTPWAGSLTVAPVDTNYRLANNQLMAPATGDVGHWIKVSVNVITGFHQMAVYKNISNTELWGNFKGSEYVAENVGLINFYVGANGTVSSQQTAENIPGEGGDTGSNPVVRLALSGNNVIVYLNNQENFTSINSFKRHLQGDETWSSPIALQAVTDAPYWGMFQAPLTSFPQKIRFGSNMSMPTSYNPNMANSLFWNSFYSYLDINPVIVKSQVYEGFNTEPTKINLVVNKRE